MFLSRLGPSPAVYRESNLLTNSCTLGPHVGWSNAVLPAHKLFIIDHCTPTHASNRCRLKSFTSCAFCGRLAAPDLVTKCIEARAVRWPEVCKFYGSLTLLHFPTGGANDAQNVSVDTARGKDNDQQNLSKMIM